MTTQAPWADRDILDRLRGCGGDPSSEDIADAIAEIERLREQGYWNGFDAALTAVEEGQRLYGRAHKAVAVLRLASEAGRALQNDLAAKAEAVSGE